MQNLYLLNARFSKPYWALRIQVTFSVLCLKYSIYELHMANTEAFSSLLSGKMHMRRKKQMNIFAAVCSWAQDVSA